MCIRPLFLLLTSCLTLLSSLPLRAQPADLHGDPLPPGAVARLGTLRFRPGTPVESLRFSADGRHILSVDDYDPGRWFHIGRLWSASTGKELASFLIPSEHHWRVTPDCQRLLTWDGTPLRIWDTSSGKLLRELPGSDGIYDLAMAGDGKTLAALQHGKEGRKILRLWRLPEGRPQQDITVAPTIDGKELQPYALFFAAGGTSLVAHSSGKKECGLRRWDLATGRELPLLARYGEDQAAPVLSADGSLLAAPEKQTEKGTAVRLVDVVSGRLRHQLGPLAGRIFGFRFSPNSRTLLAATTEDNGDSLHLWDTASGKALAAPSPGTEGIEDVLLGDSVLVIHQGTTVLLCDPHTGKLRRRLKTPWQILDELVQTGYREPKKLPGSSLLALSPDGKHLAAAPRVRSEGSRIHLWDTTSGKEVRPAAGGHDRSVVGVAFAPDGKTLATVSEDGTARLWDTSGRELHVLSAFQDDEADPARVGGVGRYCVAFSPDGKTLATCSPFNLVRQWDTRTGKLQSQHLAASGRVSALAFAPGGNTLLLGSHGRVLVWEAATAKERTSLAAPALTGLRVEEAGEGEGWVLALAVSPDGRLLAITRLGDPYCTGELDLCYELQLWELASGKMRWRLPHSPEPSITLPARLPRRNSRHPIDHGRPRVAFACDGKSLVWNREGVIEQVDVARGRPLRLLEGRAHEVTALACSPTSRLLAIAHSDGGVRLLDLATGADCARLHGHRGGVRSVAFSPDGRTLATGGDDTTVLLWDVADVLSGKPPAPAPPSAAELTRLWEQLASPQGETAAAALVRLEEAPAQAVSLLRSRLAPVPPVDPREMGRLLDALDSDSFETRRRATAALEQLGERAEPYLRRRLADRPPLELERALRALLTSAQGFVRSVEQQRALRAVEVLESIGTADARDVLRKLAEGAPESRLTQEAKASLERLHRPPQRQP